MIPKISNALQVLTHIPNASEKSVVLYGIIVRRDQILCERIHTKKKSEENTGNRIQVFWMLVLLFEIRQVIVKNILVWVILQVISKGLKYAPKKPVVKGWPVRSNTFLLFPNWGAEMSERGFCFYQSERRTSFTSAFLCMEDWTQKKSKQLSSSKTFNQAPAYSLLRNCSIYVISETVIILQLCWRQ